MSAFLCVHVWDKIGDNLPQGEEPQYTQIQYTRKQQKVTNGESRGFSHWKPPKILVIDVEFSRSKLIEPTNTFGNPFTNFINLRV